MNEKLSNALLATAKGAVSLLPGGGLLAEYIGLAQSEEFYSCVQTATTGVIRAYQEEKRQYFANALYHTAINIDLNTDKKIFYLRLLNDYTLSHISLLQYFSIDHFRPANKKSNGYTIIIGETEHPIKGIIETLPEFKADTAFVKHVAKQLISDSLISDIDFDTPVSKERARCKRITSYGKEFLDFIKEDSED